MLPLFLQKTYNLILTRFGCDDCSRLIRSHSGSRSCVGTRLNGWEELEAGEARGSIAASASARSAAGGKGKDKLRDKAPKAAKAKSGAAALQGAMMALQARDINAGHQGVYAALAAGGTVSSDDEEEDGEDGDGEDRSAEHKKLAKMLATSREAEDSALKKAASRPGELSVAFI